MSHVAAKKSVDFLARKSQAMLGFFGF